MRKLTQAQENFARLYVELGNAAEAAKRAGIGLPVPTRSYYTYLLVDPRNSQIFYVGKGKGKRVFEHEKSVRNGDVDNPRKCDLILEILISGYRVGHIIFSAHKDEGEAYAVEKEMISILREQITNISSGTTTENQRAYVQAKIHMQKLKTYEQWISSVPQRILDTASRLSGSPREHYDRHVAEMKKLMEMCHGN
jgi:hypothetical protein